MVDMVNCLDAFTGQRTRLVVVVDGLDSCEQSKVSGLKNIIPKSSFYLNNRRNKSTLEVTHHSRYRSFQYWTPFTCCSPTKGHPSSSCWPLIPTLSQKPSSSTSIRRTGTLALAGTRTSETSFTCPSSFRMLVFAGLQLHNRYASLITTKL